MTEDVGMVKLEEAVGNATAGLLAITTITKEFTETSGLLLLDTRNLKSLFDGVVSAVAAMREAKPTLVAPRGGDSLEEIKAHDAKVKEEVVNKETGEITTRESIPSIQSPAPKKSHKKGAGKKEAPPVVNGKADPSHESLFD